MVQFERGFQNYNIYFGKCAFDKKLYEQNIDKKKKNVYL